MNAELLADYRKFLKQGKTYYRTRYAFRRVAITWECPGRMAAFTHWKEGQARRRRVEEEELPDIRRGGYEKLPTFLWVEGDYRFVAQVHPDEDAYPYTEFIGVLDDKCPSGPPRYYWMKGHYDRFPGEKRSFRQFNYGHLDFDYADERRYFLRDGYSRSDADLFARGNFEHRRERLEKYAAGDIGWVGVVTTVFALADEDHEKPLADDSIWGIESDYDEDYVLERAFDCGREALTQLK